MDIILFLAIYILHISNYQFQKKDPMCLTIGDAIIIKPIYAKT